MHPLLRLLVVLLLVCSATASAAAEVITVTTDLDTDAADGECSIREAILAANSDQFYQECPAGSGDDRIVFSLTPPVTIRLTASLPQITASVRIAGPGGDQVSIDGGHSYALLNLNSPPGGGAFLFVEGITLERGFGSGAQVSSLGRALFRRVRFVDNRNSTGGGGLFVGTEAQVAVEDCLFEGNEALLTDGGAISTRAGSHVEIRGSTLVGNHAARDGGGLYCQIGTATIEHSTFTGNTAGENGGGIFVGFGDPEAVIRHSTVTGNTAGVSGEGSGGGIALLTHNGDVSFTLENTVIAKNRDDAPAGPEGDTPDLACIDNVVLVHSATSFLGSNPGCELLFPAGNPNADGNFIGSAAVPLSPQLDILRDLGGETPVHMPLLSPLSPLLDHGSCPNAAADQRGYGAPAGGRPVDLPGIGDPGGDGCDIGAVEFDGVAIPLPEIFSDGFESGTTLLWTGASP